jgi:hypothetical protein
MMDSSSPLGGGAPGQGQEPAGPEIEYTARADSPFVGGEVKMAVGERALRVSALFDSAEIPFAEMNALALADYAVTVKSDSGDYVFSRMGSWCRPFYDALCGAYGKAALRSLFVSGEPAITAKGEYRYTEGGVTVSGFAPVYVYENSVVALPPDLGARRVPLCFVTGLERGEYELTLTLDTGERYTYAKLGYDTAPFADAAEKQIRALRGKSLAAAKEIDPALTAAQASQIAKLLPEGAAAPLGRLAGIAPSFAAALEAKIAETRAAESYKAFKELCGPARIWVCFRKNEAAGASAAGGSMGVLGGAAGGGGLGGILGALAGAGAESGAESGEAEAPIGPYLLWLIAPSPDGRHAAVEFAEADSATFIYSTGGDFDIFARQMNRALEAIAFRREVVRLTDAELRKPENADYYMANKRTAALQFVRANFEGRIIHSSEGAWKRKVAELWGGARTARE